MKGDNTMYDNKQKYLLLIMSLILLSINLITAQGQQLDCSRISLEQTSAMPADVIAIYGVSDETPDLSIIAVSADGTPLDILLATERQPFIFVDEAIIKQFNSSEFIPILSSSVIALYAEPSAESQVIGSIAAETKLEAQARNMQADWLQVEAATPIGTQIGWVQASQFYTFDELTSLPIYDDEMMQTDEASLFLLVPFHPDDPISGGGISIIIGDDTSECESLSLQITQLPDAHGAFEQTVTYFGEMLALQREDMEVTREELLVVDPVDLPSHLVTLAVSQRLYDGHNNTESLLAIQQQISDGTFTEEEQRFLDAIIARTGLTEYLETEIESYIALQEMRRERSVMQAPVNQSGYAPLMKQSTDVTVLQYPTINTGGDLAREMTAATSALYRLTDGASGKVLNDLGAVAAVGNLFTGGNPVTELIFDIGGKMIYIEKSRLEMAAYSGPTVFQDFQVNITPEIILNENGVSDAEWTVSLVVATTPWRISRLNAYDASRFVSSSTPLSDIPGLDIVDAVSAVCGGNGSPCGEIPEFATIEAHTWTINDIDEPQLFEVSRPEIPGDNIYSYALPNPNSLNQASNRLMPINAGRYPLLVKAPRETFGLYSGEGFNSTDVIVSEIDITYEAPNPMPDLILAPGETQRLCYTVGIDHALQEEGRNDIVYEVKDSDGNIVASGELIHEQEFCFTVGPIEPTTWTECVLVSTYKHYIVELSSLAENGPRGAEEWHDESLAPERTESFFVRVDGEESQEPDECQPGLWYLVLGDITMTCSTLTTTIPINSAPIPISADSLNSGTSVFGRLDQVLTMPGAEVIPPDVASDIAEADRTIDGLQTTNMEIDSAGTLFTNIPEIAQAGASYVVVMPIDSTGEIPGEILFTMMFTTDTAFEGEMLMKLNVPGAGVCEITTPLNGYFEPNESP